MITLFAILGIKHFIFDFLYQPPFMWKNKGTFGHIGGIVHSGLHAIATFAILLFLVAMPLALVISVAEFVVHYLTDWAKMNINRIKGWGATTHNEFWILTGLDQLFHYLTYVGIVAAVYGVST